MDIKQVKGSLGKLSSAHAPFPLLTNQVNAHFSKLIMRCNMISGDVRRNNCFDLKTATDMKSETILSTVSKKLRH